MLRFSLVSIILLCLCVLNSVGCKGHQYARVIKPGEREMVGSHAAGQETFKPLIEESVGKLLAKHEPEAHVQVSSNGQPLPPGKMHICFVGVENHTSEEIGDFKEQIYEIIDAKLLDSHTFVPISRRYVDSALRESRLRPDQLFIPDNMRMFSAILEQQGQPFDYLMFAKITSGTTRENKDYQRDYLLTVELVDIRTGQVDKQNAEISKGYHHSWMSRFGAQTWPFSQR
jgi:Peptidoglycan-synthase activator LpoB